MFFRLLLASFLRQRRPKLLAGIAILLGTTAVTAMLALATTIGDRIHRELAVYGANIVVTPKADTLAVKLGGVDLKPATGGTTLHEADLTKLRTIFWANNITGISPELHFSTGITAHDRGSSAPAIGVWFDHPLGAGTLRTGAPSLHPAWKLTGRWPMNEGETAIGSGLALRLGIGVGDRLSVAVADAKRDHDGMDLARLLQVTGVVDSGETAVDGAVLMPLAVAQERAALPGAIDRVEISAKTRPEDAFARADPDTLAPKQREIWYCRPYANSIAYQIQEAIPGSSAQQVRRVEQGEGLVLGRISGLMWLVCAAALLAAGFAVSAAMATAVAERRGEIGLMRSLGAGRAAIGALFYTETAVLALAAGAVGFVAGSALAAGLGAHIFPGEGAPPLFNAVLFPLVLALALGVAAAGSTPSIRAALRLDPADTLRGGA